MKRLLSSILIIMALSSASYAAATKTEIIEEEVCHAVAGCWMNPKTGECPDCVIETRKIVTEIKDTKPVNSILPRSVVILKKEEPKVIKISEKMCFFPKMAKDLSKGYRSCNWRGRGARTAAAVKRGTEECGGFMNWTWTDRYRTEYICKG